MAMSVPQGWVKVNSPWQSGRLQIGSDVYAPPNEMPPAPAGTVPGVGIPPGGYGGNVPTGLLDKNTANINDAANGVLPADVIAQIQNHAASFGVANGIPGSDFSGYRGLTQLGLTSLARQDEASKWLQPFYQTPGQKINVDQTNAANIYAGNQAEYQRAMAARSAGNTAWNAMKSGGSPMIVAPGGGGGPMGPGGGNPTANNYQNDINSFVQKYLPGAGASGPLNFGASPTGNPGAGVPTPQDYWNQPTSEDLQPAGADYGDWQDEGLY